MNILSSIGDAFHFVLFVPIINLLVALYHGLNFVHLPFALGFSIIVLTVLIRLVLYPLTGAQLKASKKMQELTPHLNRLKEKHKNDAKTLQAETMKLYKEFGVNPAAGCLPVLIQLPLIWALYQALQLIVKPGAAVLAQINQMLYTNSLKLTTPWNTTFFGLPLAQNPSHLITTVGPLILLIPVATGLFQFIQTKMMFVSQPQNKDGNKKDEKKKEDFATAFQSQSLYIFPIMIAFFSYSFPIGLSLYWNTFTIFGIIQQYRISGLGGLKEWTDKIYGKSK
ncbi:MAG TPA: YidC/Oxa1 family membrane protein insertase [Patescibacteria group bacterium]|jgi:YidC/Oxa1 family membrane protein insertase|nr:YidC/Oxa1 family membrane protein insertase [Patescibacteria group bacterium]